MNRHVLLALSLMLGGCQTLSGLRSDRLLSPEEVKTLFSGRTVESYNRNTRLTSFTYYRPDGRVLQQRFWSWRTGHWRVTPKGKICLKFELERCRYILAEGDRYTKVKRKKGQLTKLVRYRGFLQGNLILRSGSKWPESPRFRP